MSNTPLHSLDQHALAALMQRYQSDDWLQLSDAVLRAALDGSTPLSRTEWQAVLNSPLTLRRMQMLEAERCAAQATPPIPAKTTAPAAPATTAANDGQWQCSQGLLRAADSGAETSTLNTEDGWWSLTFPRTHGGWKMVLRLAHSAPFASLFAPDTHAMQAGHEVAVVDGTGRTLLQGMIDDENELYGRWPMTEAPLAVLKAAGGFQVMLT